MPVGVVPKNPFALVYTTLWGMMLEHPGFVADVPEGNRIKFVDLTNRDPNKLDIATADLPEVALISSSVTSNLFNTSNTSMIMRNYTWLLSSGDFRYYVDEKTPMLATLEWYIFVAMHGWKQKLGALTWRDRKFVKKCNTTAGMTGLSDPARNRGISGWSASWSVEVEMHFDTRSLMYEMPEILPLPPE
jgi:hypothetical protein